MWLLKGFAVLVGLIVLGVAGILILLATEHGSETLFPKPSGPYAVGRTIVSWRDPTQTDPSAPQPGQARELVAWIWYPASVQGKPPSADYLPAAWRAAVEQARGTLMTRFLTRDLARVRVYSYADAELSPAQPTYPVIVMRAGLAALTAEYTSLAEDLASHGYVVVGVDAPYRTQVVVFPDGRVVRRTAENDPEIVSGEEQNRIAQKLLAAWSADMAFTVDQLQRLNADDPSNRFKGRLDLDHLGAFGHSLGGAVVAQFCHDDSRCKAGIDMDGAPLGKVVQEGLPQPFMFLVGEQHEESNADDRRILANIHGMLERSRPDQRWLVMIRGANHFGFSDVTLVKSQRMLKLLHWAGIMHLDGRQQLQAAAFYIRSFFDAYLKGAPASSLMNPPAGFPQVDITH